MAADVVLTPRAFGPEEALRAGFVSRFVSAGDLGREADAVVAAMARLR